ncbi:MAG TPA: TRAP transporter small permease [Dongiaceae bacterium]|nr:TRAP transporter small permease [Dongiaceae bacterium]
MLLRILTPVNAWIARLCMYAAVAGLLAIVAVVAWQVFGRYVLNDTPTWAEALALLLVLYVTMLGAAVGVRDAGHIGLDSMMAFLVPARHRVWFEYASHVLVGTFGILMAWHGGVLAATVMAYKIPILGLPEGMNHVPLVIAGGLIALFSLEHILALTAGKKVVPSWH